MTAVMSPPARRYALVVTSHRGDLYLPGSVENWRQMLPWDSFILRLVHMDRPTGLLPEGDVLLAPLPYHLGLSGAVKGLWGLVPADVTHVFHLEEDFHLCGPVDLDAMADVVDRDGLANLVLLRQPANTAAEQITGGYLHDDPDRFVQLPEYLHHHEGFWLNPCVIPADVIREGGGNEPELTARWKGRGFGVWGQRNDPPRCWHVGDEGGMGTPGWKP